MEKERFQKIISEFQNKKILVIGDIMLDRYITGKVNRISPESPIPIVNVESETYNLGGAANVATNITSLSGKVMLLGFIGKDKAGEKIISLTSQAGIQFFPISSTNTTIKTRIIGEGQQIVRFDKENTLPKFFSPDLILQEARKADLVIISDYAKGAITENLFLELQKQNPTTKIFVDPKPKNSKVYKNAFLIKQIGRAHV